MSVVDEEEATSIIDIEPSEIHQKADAVVGDENRPENEEHEKSEEDDDGNATPVAVNTNNKHSNEPVNEKQEEIEEENKVTTDSVLADVSVASNVEEQQYADALPKNDSALTPSDDLVKPLTAESTKLIEIKFIVLPEGFLHFAYFKPKTIAAELYNHLTRTLWIERRTIKLSGHTRQLYDTDVLEDVVDITFPPVTLNVELDFIPKHLLLLQKYEHASKALEVKIEFGEGIPHKAILVSVVKGYHHKQFVGGYRNKNNGTEYHHGVAQTEGLKREPKAKAPSYSRVTQTIGIARSQQTKREAWTQMARPGLEIETTRERIVVARTYFFADDLHTLRVIKSIVVQAHIRGWFARRLAKRMREEEESRKLEIQKTEELRRQEVDEKKQKEVQRRTHPRTAADFAILYNELEAWRLQELSKIDGGGMKSTEKQLAKVELLKKQTRLLQTIDRLQIKANNENKLTGTRATLGAMATHKVWEHSKTELGKVTVETPFTVRAKELLDLYNALQLHHISVDERLDILLHVKWTVKEFECSLTREIVELVDREADLLNRGRKEKMQQGLRQRLSNLFLQFCETPEFNPEAINHQKVPLEFTNRPLAKLDHVSKK